MQDPGIDTYKTIHKKSNEVLFKEQKSKFYGYVFPLEDIEAVKLLVQDAKRKHPTANHACYAWRIGVEEVKYRANDDGEPNNSAGMPIYGQILAFNVTNILVVVVRIFGGTKLGVGGLMGAYKATAQLALSHCEMVEKTVQAKLKVSCAYDELDKVLRIVRQNEVTVLSQTMELICCLLLSVRKTEAKKVIFLLEQMNGIEVIEL
jgi:uncharacterized YigZ family protein